MSASDDVGERFGVSRETRHALDLYVEALLTWQRAINLIGPSTVDDVWYRHITDSLQLLPMLDGKHRIADLGSGAGLPGMVLAIALRERKDGNVTLIESNEKKAAFLRHVAMLTQAPVSVAAERIEAALPKLLPPPDVITARALAPLEHLIRWCEPLLKSGALGLFHKGRDLQSELDEASRYWDIEHEVIPSVVASSSYILKIRAIRPRNAGERQ